MSSFFVYLLTLLFGIYVIICFTEMCFITSDLRHVKWEDTILNIIEPKTPTAYDTPYYLIHLLYLPMSSWETDLLHLAIASQKSSWDMGRSTSSFDRARISSNFRPEVFRRIDISEASLRMTEYNESVEIYSKFPSNKKQSETHLYTCYHSVYYTSHTNVIGIALCHRSCDTMGLYGGVNVKVILCSGYPVLFFIIKETQKDYQPADNGDICPGVSLKHGSNLCEINILVQLYFPQVDGQ